MKTKGKEKQSEWKLEKQSKSCKEEKRQKGQPLQEIYKYKAK